MDIRTKLEDEIIFSERANSKRQIDTFKKKGIYTVEDFINCDIEKIFYSFEAWERFRGIKDILKYKYLGQPLTINNILDYEYSDKTQIEKSLWRQITRLGFAPYNYNYIAEQLINKNGSCKVIDVISHIPDEHGSLKEFYLEYYSRVKNLDDEELSNEARKNYLETLKNEVNTLLIYKNELDVKLSSLLEQIAIFEENNNTKSQK